MAGCLIFLLKEEKILKIKKSFIFGNDLLF